MASGQQGFDQKIKSLYNNTVPLIYAQELSANYNDLLILDTREIHEWKVSHLPDALCVGYEKFDSKMLLDIDRSKNIVVYCSVGYRSEKIGEKLVAMGFKNVKNLYGGIFDWKNQGFEVVNSKGIITDSVHTYNKDWSQWLYKGIKSYE